MDTAHGMAPPEVILGENYDETCVGTQPSTHKWTPGLMLAVPTDECVCFRKGGKQRWTGRSVKAITMLGKYHAKIKEARLVDLTRFLEDVASAERKMRIAQ